MTKEPTGTARIQGESMRGSTVVCGGTGTDVGLNSMRKVPINYIFTKVKRGGVMMEKGSLKKTARDKLRNWCWLLTCGNEGR